MTQTVPEAPAVIHMKNAVPTFLVGEVGATARWYGEHLGFDVAGTFPATEPYAYASLQRGGAELMLLRLVGYEKPDLRWRRPEGLWDAYCGPSRSFTCRSSNSRMAIGSSKCAIPTAMFWCSAVDRPEAHVACRLTRLMQPTNAGCALHCPRPTLQWRQRTVSPHRSFAPDWHLARRHWITCDVIDSCSWD